MMSHSPSRTRERARPAAGTARRAMSLVEMFVALGISAIITCSVYVIMWRGQTLERQLTDSSGALQAVRIRVKRMTDELQEGTRLFYPLPGRQSSSGLGLVNARGETIFYYVSPPDGDDRSLWRECANDGGKSREIVVPRIVWFRATTAEASKGRVPSLVNLDLNVATEVQGVEANIVTAAFLGSLEKNLPDDSTDGPWPFPEAK